MKQTELDIRALPPSVLRLVKGKTVIADAAGRSDAFVAFVGDDLVIKCDRKGGLKAAADMQAYYHARALAPEVVWYESADRDYLVSRRAAGKPAFDAEFLAQPIRLARALGEFLARLHALDAPSCPVRGLTARWLRDFDGARERGARLYAGVSEFLRLESAEKAAETVAKNRLCLRSDTPVHGDYCLPNVMLVNFQPAQVIDTGEGGLGDRHFDLFWGMWSLWYNLKSDAYGREFLTAYGKNSYEEELIYTCGCLCCIE